MQHWMREGDIQRLIMIAVQEKYPGALVRRMNTGAARDATGRVVRFGVKGQADIACIIEGYAIEIEVKTNTGRQSKAQKSYQRAVERAGGLYILAREVADTLETINKWITNRNS